MSNEENTDQIQQNIRQVEQNIAEACRRVGRDPESVRLLPVSKTKPLAAVIEATKTGITRFGENRVQEMVEKQDQLAQLESHPPVSWAVIGPLQSNKAKLVAEYAAEFQALSTEKIAQVLNNRLEKLGKKLDVLLQVNTSGEATKSGLSPEEVVPFAKSLEPYECLNPLGLMTIATNTHDKIEIARCFDQMVQVQNQLRDDGALGLEWNELSMGMSADYELAVEHGATIVRVGSQIFGQRAYPANTLGYWWPDDVDKDAPES